MHAAASQQKMLGLHVRDLSRGISWKGTIAVRYFQHVCSTFHYTLIIDMASHVPQMRAQFGRPATGVAPVGLHCDCAFLMVQPYHSQTTSVSVFVINLSSKGCPWSIMWMPV